MKTLQKTTALFLITITALLISAGAAAPLAQRSYRDIPLSNGVAGPESIAFDCNGMGPYVGVSDGRILKWNASKKVWTVFAYTSSNWTTGCSEAYDEQERLCGRPLGLKFDAKTCTLYIADAYYGLMAVGRDGGRARSLVDGVDGIPFQFTNALDLDDEAGVIYLTDSSTRFQRWQFFSIISSNDSTGRLMKYDIRARTIEVLLTNLSFANGVALSKNRDFVLITETTLGQVRKFWLRGPRTGTSEVFIQLSACPDNINRNKDGDFWIAQNPPEMFSLSPFVGSSGERGSAVRVSEAGEVVEALDGDRNNNGITASDVKEFGGRLWIGSVIDNYIEVTNY